MNKFGRHTPCRRCSSGRPRVTCPAPSNARRNVSPSSYWSDSFPAIKLNRKQLRDETRLSPYADANQKPKPTRIKTRTFNRSQLRLGIPNEDEYSWVADTPASNTAFGVRLDDEEVVNRLRSAFPEHFEEGEHFALLDKRNTSFVLQAKNRPKRPASVK